MLLVGCRLCLSDRILPYLKVSSSNQPTGYEMRLYLLQYYVNLATSKFAEYVRQRSYRRIIILQGSGNKADSVELQVPKGRKYEKIILIECGFQNKYHECNIVFC